MKEENMDTSMPEEEKMNTSLSEDEENKPIESSDDKDSPKPDGFESADNVDQAVEKKRPVALLVIFNVLTSLVLAASILATGVLGFCIYIFGEMRYNVEFPKPDDHEELGIAPEIVEKLPSGIVNIALFGIDSRNTATDNSKAIKGRSDSIMILSIDSDKKTVKMTSILRDSWVPMDYKGGTRYDKITHAYAYGGPTLSVKTINQNFDLNISEYASVSMYQLASVIDDIGGIDIEITEKERQAINKSAFLYGSRRDNEIQNSGLVHMNGPQAIAFARIRKIDTDMKRAQRHQKVLTAMLKQIKTLPVSDYPSLLRKVLGRVETSMTYDEIFQYVPLVTSSSLKIETTTIPGNDVKYKKGIFSDTRGGWVWKYDLKEATEYLHKWIYGIEEQSDGSDSSAPSNATSSDNPPTESHDQSAITDIK